MVNQYQLYGEKELEIEKERFLVKEVKIFVVLDSESVIKMESLFFEISSVFGFLENVKKE